MRILHLVVITVVMYVAVAWFTNIYKLVNADFVAPYKTEVVRTISIVPPIAAVTAFMDIGEENK